MEATCKKNKLCAFDDQEDYNDAVKERCIFCGRVAIFRKDTFGRLDNRKYLRYHLRDTAQPSGITARAFFEIYGEETTDQLKAFRKHQREYKPDSWNLRAEDAKTMIRELRKERSIY